MPKVTSYDHCDMQNKPDNQLKRIRELAAAYIRNENKDIAQLSLFFLDLDEWLVSGGILPTAWETALRPAEAEELEENAQPSA